VAHETGPQVFVDQDARPASQWFQNVDPLACVTSCVEQLRLVRIGGNNDPDLPRLRFAREKTYRPLNETATRFTDALFAWSQEEYGMSMILGRFTWLYPSIELKPNTDTEVIDAKEGREAFKAGLKLFRGASKKSSAKS
jgi:hypothetical protein